MIIMEEIGSESIKDNKNPIGRGGASIVQHAFCIISQMKLDRKIRWNPDKEEFVNDPEAAAMLSRPSKKKAFYLMS